MTIRVEGSSLLVVGGAGFVGSNLVRMALDAGAASIHVIDNLLSAEERNIPVSPKVRFTCGSAGDETLLVSLADDYDYVFHLGVFHGNQNSMHDPLADHANSLFPTLALFEKIKGFRRIKKVVYAGAGCAVAEKTDTNAKATSEDASISLDMDSPYSISKIVGEFYALYYHRQSGLPTVRARFQNIYGPGEILGAGQWRGTISTIWRNVTPTFIYKSLAGEALPLEGGGKATRDFIYVEDIVRGLLRCATHGEAGEVYNLATGVEISIAELAHTINELTGSRTAVHILPGRDWDRSGCRYGNPQKACEKIGFSAEVGLREGLQKTVEWTRANLTMVEACIRRHDGKY